MKKNLFPIIATDCSSERPLGKAVSGHVGNSRKASPRMFLAFHDAGHDVITNSRHTRFNLTQEHLVVEHQEDIDTQTKTTVHLLSRLIGSTRPRHDRLADPGTMPPAPHSTELHIVEQLPPLRRKPRANLIPQLRPANQTRQSW